MGKIISNFENLAEKILSFAKKVENIKSKTPEVIVLVLYPVLCFAFGYFHEPWFDEVQAWQIAKWASYHDILFYLPHYEVHPPLWHLILSVFAKNNFPFEISIKSISFLFSYISLILILFKAPFCRIIRLLLPFTYFLFYEYTIISRPYCLIMLAFSLLAIFYNERNIKPYKYALGLLFLSITHSLCFIFSFCLAFVWLIESIIKKTFTSIKTTTLILLLMHYTLLAYMILPSPDTHAINLEHLCNLFTRLYYTFLILPGECFISDINKDIHILYFSWSNFILGSFCGIIIWYFIYFYTKNKEFIFLTFLIPYCTYAICTSNYLSTHHTGMLYCFIIFISWITLNAKDIKQSKNNKMINNCFILFITLFLSTGIYWSLKSCILDTFIKYTIGKEEAEFIKNHHLDNYNIMMEWPKDNPGLKGNWINVAPYFDHKIFYNLNDENSKENYVIHKNLSQKEVENTYKRWDKYGIPDVIAGSRIDFDKFSYEDKKSDYIIVYINEGNYIKKGTLFFNHLITIRVKKELANKLNMTEAQYKYREYNVTLQKIIASVVVNISEYFKNHQKEIK